MKKQFIELVWSIFVMANVMLVISIIFAFFDVIAEAFFVYE